jgi:hypothetical protein
MRTRSVVARQRSLLKLPEDCIRHVALFIDCDVDGARLALTSRRVMRSLTPAVWAKILKASHGGLKIAAADLDDGLRVAARLAAARADEGPVDGFFALATNYGAAPYGQQQYWADALFRREPWRIYCSRSNPDGEPVLCAAAFLAGGDDERFDRRYMLDRLEEEDRALLQQGYRDGRCNLAYVFDDVYGHMEGGRTSRICQEIQRYFEQQQEFGNPWFRSGLSATSYQARGNDGIEVDPRVERLVVRPHPATAIATGITIRRAMNFTCPARCGIIYGFRRPPRVSDISDGRLKDLAAAAAPTISGIINAENGSFWGGRTLRELRSCFVGLEPVYLLGSAAPGICVQLIGGDENEEVFPLAVFCFRSREDWDDLREMPDMRANLAVPVAIQGLAVAVVEIDDHSDGEANVDLEYVGIEGYAYVPPDHEPVPPDHRL